MDDFSMEGIELAETLQTIAAINQLLGGNRLTLNGLKKLIKTTDSTQTLSICDVGCGNGDMLREIAKFGQANGYSFKLTGIDANPFTIKEARRLSENYPNIHYCCEDVLIKPESELNNDIVLFTLFLHHFNDVEVKNIIHSFLTNTSIGIIINDLHRSAVSYRLFQLVCFVFRLKKMPRTDGLLSILKGFKKKELIHFSKKIIAKKQTIQWKWAFRYQWIIYK